MIQFNKIFIQLENQGIGHHYSARTYAAFDLNDVLCMKKICTNCPDSGNAQKKTFFFHEVLPYPQNQHGKVVTHFSFLFPFSFYFSLLLLRNFHYNQHILGPGTVHLENTAGITVVLNNKPFTVYVDVEERDSFSPLGGT